MSTPLRNWAGNYQFSTTTVHRPTTVEQVQDIVRGGGKLRVLGSRHSFNDIADSPVALIALDQLSRVVAIDRERQTVTVEAGVTYGQLCPQLHAAGLALHNLASLPHISVAGSCATATHGSGDRNGNLATSVVGMEIVTGSGELATVSREQSPEQLAGAAVHLGALGVVTRVTLAVQPTFAVRQDVYEQLPLSQLEANFDQLTGAGYSVSLFTDWGGDTINQVWVKRLAADGQAYRSEPELFGAALVPVDRHPIAGLSAENCTVQKGLAGPWHQRLPHFRMEFTPSNGDELQSEYFVPRRHALAALHAIHGLRERVTPLLLISEIRTIAADELWMSPCYQQDSVAFHFTWKPDWPGVREVLPLIEERLAPFAARPHWGKLFTLAPEQLRSRYPRLADFQALMGQYDPRGVFRNPFLERYL